MLRVLIDTCVYLDLAKDYRHQPTLRALEQLINVGEVSLVLPRQAVDEFARNKQRLIKESGKSLSSTFKRVKAAVREFGREDGVDSAIEQLDDVDHRVTILGEAVNESIARIEAIFAKATVIETTDAVKLRAAQRAVDKRAPFHRDKNGMGDAILIETYRDVLDESGDEVQFAFVTHNKHDFSDMNADERLPHPDLRNLFDSEGSTYSLALAELLNSFAPERLDELKWEFEYVEEPRLLSEIMEAEELLFRQIWYNRHMYLRHQIETGKHKLVTEEVWNKNRKRHAKMTVDTVWERALAAAKRTEDEVGREHLGPWTEFEWGMLNGKLSALRWVTGSDWDFLDT
jgi:hypothetical protein